MYFALLLLTAAGGALSGFMWLFPNGLMAAAMALCYSLGTIWLAEKESRNPGSVRWADALAAGIVTGMLAVFPVAWLESMRPVPGRHMEFFRPPAMDTWYYVSAPIVFGIVTHLSYHRRKGSKNPLSRVLLTAFVLAGAARLALALIDQNFMGAPVSYSDIAGMIVSGVFLFLFMVVPFPLLWMLITSRLDPAWKAGIQTDDTDQAMSPESTPAGQPPENPPGN